MTDQVHWWLVGLAFGLGMVLTFTLAVRPVKYQLPVGAPARGAVRAVAKPKRSPAKKTAAAKKTPAAKKPVGKKKVVTKEPVAKQITEVKESPEEHLPHPAEPLMAQLPKVPFAPYGPGSARAGADGSGPVGWLVKGRSDTRLYYTPEDSSYDPTVAQVWFEDEASAARAFFSPWRKSTRRK